MRLRSESKGALYQSWGRMGVWAHGFPSYITICPYLRSVKASDNFYDSAERLFALPYITRTEQI